MSTPAYAAGLAASLYRHARWEAALASLRALGLSEGEVLELRREALAAARTDPNADALAILEAQLRARFRASVAAAGPVSVEELRAAGLAVVPTPAEPAP
jgi:hypothetical protein